MWTEAQGVGKFAEEGQRYFDITWDKAESKTRLKLYDQAAAETEKTAPSARRPRKEMVRREEEPGQPPDGPEGDGSPDSDEEDGDLFFEEITDPHRLATIFLTLNTQEGAHTVAYFREGWWRWMNNSWRQVADSEMEAAVYQFARCQVEQDFPEYLEMGMTPTSGGETSIPVIPAITPHLIRNIQLAVRGRCTLSNDMQMPCWRGAGPPARNLIATSNGLLDVDAFLAGRSDVLLPHTPLWFSSVCLPYPFDPAAQCPKWTAFLKRNLGDDASKQRFLQQWYGYNAVQDTTLQACMEFIGEGDNGKSVACTVLTALLGERNISRVPLEMFGEKFHLIATLGKLANIVTEVSEMDKLAEAKIKQFVVGDAMQFEDKHKRPFEAYPTARITVSANTPIMYSDKSKGMFRRRLILPFVVEITAEEKVRGMDKAEFWRDEMSGVLNWALAGLHDLRTCGEFVVPQSCVEAAEAHRQFANPARRFLLERYREEKESKVATEAVYRDYREWCFSHGHGMLSDNRFGMEVRRAFRKVDPKPGKTTVDARRVNAYVGLVAKSAKEELA